MIQVFAFIICKFTNNYIQIIKENVKWYNANDNTNYGPCYFKYILVKRDKLLLSSGQTMQRYDSIWTEIWGNTCIGCRVWD